MSRISDERLGRRRFQLVRERAVEDAVEKIQHAPAVKWDTLSPDECTRLREILGEFWSGLERERWNTYSFSLLTRQDVEAILVFGAEARSGSLSLETIQKIDSLLTHAGNGRCKR